MFDPKFFDDLSKKLADSIPDNVKILKSDTEKHFKHIIQTMFAKMDLITREEFDIQTLVLSKTRAKLENLEKKLNLLEKQLSKNKTIHPRKTDS